MSEVVPGLSEFGHIQKLGQNLRSFLRHVERNPVLTEFAQVPMRSALQVKMKLSNKEARRAEKIVPGSGVKVGERVGHCDRDEVTILPLDRFKYGPVSF
jgi:hypothetical protein